MLPRWQAGTGTTVVLVLGLTLIGLDIANRPVRRFWQAHAFTADTVAGLLVLALTVLVVNQVLHRRQFTERSRVVAAQAGIILGQASRSVKAVRAARDNDGDRGAAGDEIRTYFLMLLVGAPVMIDSPVSREFLEKANHLAAQMAQVLAPPDVADLIARSTTGTLDEAIESLRNAAAPLLAVLTPPERAVVAEESG